jgi:hypothetical protein
LRYYVNENQNNWVQLLLTAQFVYNNTKNKIMNITSFWANYKYDSKIWQDSQNHESQNQKQFWISLKSKTASRFDRKTWEADERENRNEVILSWRKVYFWMNNIWMKRQSKKLNNKSIESFKIVKDIKS